MIQIQFLLLFFPLSCLSKLITINTTRGVVQGFDHEFGHDVSQRFYGYGQIFLGIPFAKPPVGERRFKLPEPIQRYNESGEVYNATYYRPRCWQSFSSHPASEDCLYLHVMTPNVSGSYPVLVFIHGGTFTNGGADIYHWKGAVRNLVSRGLVVVTIQYRLGLLGFFTTFTETFPPNRGIYDQILALRWIKEEISNFGGDSNRITLYGQSAGASSVSLLSLSPMARGLFHRLIQTSGSILTLLETINNPRRSIHQDRARQICMINSTNWGSLDKDQELLNCFTNADPNQLVAHDFSDGKNWNAAIDGAILPDTIENLAAIRPKYPTMMGDMLDEFAIFIPGVAIGGDLSHVTQRSVQEFLQHDWPIFSNETAKKIADIAMGAFSSGKLPDEKDHLGWTKLVTETQTSLLFSSFMHRDAQWHRKAGNDNVWLFTFTHRSMLPFSFDVEGWIPISHSSELPYLWFYPENWERKNVSEADFAVANYLGGMWAHFAHHGDLPIPRATENMNYLDIGSLLSLKSDWRSTANEVYNEKIPALLGEFPPLTMTEGSWKTIRALGERVASHWNSLITQ